MSTRCNVKIRMGETVVWFYRHYDGYPSETGADLYTKIADAKNFTDMTQSLLSDDCYEITDMKHGDIEWMYEFNWETETRIRSIQCNQENLDSGKLSDFYSGTGIEAVGGYCNFVLDNSLGGN